MALSCVSVLWGACCLDSRAAAMGKMKDPVFIGARACGACHDGPARGHQFSKWRLSAHARASTSLALNDLCFTPDGKRAFVSNRLDDSVSVVDVAARQVVAVLTVGDEPHGVLVDQQGRHLYILDTSIDNISVFDVATLREVRRLSALRGSSDPVAVLDVQNLAGLLKAASHEERARVIPNHLGKSDEFVLARLPVASCPKGLTGAVQVDWQHLRFRSLSA